MARRSVRILPVTLLVAGLALVLIAQGSAQAHDHSPPETVLKKGTKELQGGRLTDEYRWSYPSRSGNACFTDDAVLVFGFPRDVPTVAPGSKLKIRIDKRHKPESFVVQEVDREGVPRGDLSVLLKPVVRDGKTVGWDAVFALNRPDADYRLLAEGHWQDRDCTKAEPIDPDQFARWSFRVKTGSAI